jgi:hypothetical protein
MPITQKMIQSFDVIDESDVSTNDNRGSSSITTLNGSGGDNLPQLSPSAGQREI